mgnify:CR=1 FL=1
MRCGSWGRKEAQETSWLADSEKKNGLLARLAVLGPEFSPPYASEYSGAPARAYDGIALAPFVQDSRRRTTPSGERPQWNDFRPLQGPLRTSIWSKR